MLDMRLPFMSGIEVCKKIKDTDKLKCIPVILFTASTGSIEENVKDAGADDFLFKPFDEKILLEKLKKFLG